MNAKNAIDWHSLIANEFDSKYIKKSQFMERGRIWDKYIQRYSNPHHRVADIGCGSGVFSFLAAGLNHSVIGLDGSADMIGLCEKKLANVAIHNVRFAIAELQNMAPLAGADNDLTICSSVIEYVDDLEAAIDMLRSVTKREGVILLSMPNASSLYRRLEALAFRLSGRPAYYSFVKHVVTVNKMEKVLRARGLEPIEHSYFSKTPGLSRLLSRLGMEKYSHNLFILAARCG